MVAEAGFGPAISAYETGALDRLTTQLWYREPGMIRRPIAYQAIALPTELSRCIGSGGKVSRLASLGYEPNTGSLRVTPHNCYSRRGMLCAPFDESAQPGFVAGAASPLLGTVNPRPPWWLAPLRECGPHVASSTSVITTSPRRFWKSRRPVSAPGARCALRRESEVRARREFGCGSGYRTHLFLG